MTEVQHPILSPAADSRTQVMDQSSAPSDLSAPGQGSVVRWLSGRKRRGHPYLHLCLGYDVGIPTVENSIAPPGLGREER